MADSFIGKVLHQFFRNWMRGSKKDGSNEYAREASEFVAEMVVKGVESAFDDADQASEQLLRDVFELDSEQPDDQAAAEIARHLRGLLPAEIRTLDAAAQFEGPSVYESLLFGAPRSPIPEQLDLNQLISALPAKMRPKMKEYADQVSNQSKFPSRWSLQFISVMFEMWEEMLDVLEETCDFEKGLLAINNFRKLISTERRGVAERYQEAERVKAIRGEGLRGSIPLVGWQVHNTLQLRHLLWSSPNTIISESWVYWYQIVLQQERLLIYGREHFEKTGDPSFLIADQAHISPFHLDELYYLRHDILNMTSPELFEIKPVGSAPDAVIQEIYYRMSYEMVAVKWICDYYDPDVVRIFPGSSLNQNWMRDPVTMDFSIDVSLGTAMPFMLDSLPGIVLYTVSMHHEDELEEVLKAYRALRKAIEKAQEAYRKVVRAIRVMRIILTIIIVLVVLIVIIVVLVTSIISPPIPAPNPVEVPGFGGGEVIPFPGAPAPEKRRKAASLRVIISGGEAILVLARDRTGERKLTRFRCGSVVVDGIYADEVPGLVDGMVSGLERAAEAMSRYTPNQPDSPGVV